MRPWQSLVCYFCEELVR